MRRMQLEYIGWLVGFLRMYQPILPVIERLAQDKRQIHDLCSGSGRPAMYLSAFLNQHWLLSDLYPQQVEDLPSTMKYLKHPLDVKTLVPEKDVLYTMFNAFHHFTPEEQLKMLSNLSQSHFVIAEILKPSISDFIKILLTTTILQVVSVPFQKPFTLKRLFFTWIIPLNLITVTWDGLVSVLRSIPEQRYRYWVKCFSDQGVKLHFEKTGPFWARVYVLYKA